MPMYLGPGGQIFDHPVPGGTLLNTGNIPPPPGPRNPPQNRNTPRNPPQPAPAPAPAEAGGLRKLLFWLTALSTSGGMGLSMGTFLTTFAFENAGADGFIGSVSGFLVNTSPVILCVMAVFLTLCFGSTTGSEHNYNLAGLILTLLSAGGICLLFAVGLALVPYLLALVGYLLIFGLVVGVIASIFGG